MVAAVNSSAMLIASRYETARSSRVRAPFLIHYHIFQKGGTSLKTATNGVARERLGAACCVVCAGSVS
jgi:hypothetical protein